MLPFCTVMRSVWFWLHQQKHVTRISKTEFIFWCCFNCHKNTLKILVLGKAELVWKFCFRDICCTLGLGIGSDGRKYDIQHSQFLFKNVPGAKCIKMSNTRACTDISFLRLVPITNLGLKCDLWQNALVMVLGVCICSECTNKKSVLSLKHAHCRCHSVCRPQAKWDKSHSLKHQSCLFERKHKHFIFKG